MEPIKTCTRCGQSKPGSAMGRDKRRADGISSFCKTCHQAASVAWQKANPERLNATRRARYAKRKDEINATRRAAYDGAAVRGQRLLYLYGLTVDAYDALLAKQGGGCAICGVKPEAGDRAFHVDHDHACCPKAPTCTKCTRGILCHGCNTALTMIENNPQWAANAHAYLEGSK